MNSDQRLNFSDFSDRTDALARHYGIRIADLAAKLSMSTDMLMGYRTGRYPITSKAWRKLRAAEFDASSVPQSQSGPSPEAKRVLESEIETRARIPASALEIVDVAGTAATHFYAAERALMLCIKARPVFQDEAIGREFSEQLRIYIKNQARGVAAIEQALKALEDRAYAEIYRVKVGEELERRKRQGTEGQGEA